MKRQSREEPARAAGERRRKAILDAAYDLFVEKGYDAVSIDDIIRRAGGSKATLYGFFKSKEGVLKAVVESLSGEMLLSVPSSAAVGKDLRQNLVDIGFRIADTALSDYALNQYRLAVANAKPLPELSRIWYELGPKKVFDGVARYLSEETRAGRLRVEHPERAALFFLGMLIFKDNFTMSVGYPRPSRKQMKANVEEAVEVFLSAYGAR